MNAPAESEKYRCGGSLQFPALPTALDAREGGDAREEEEKQNAFSLAALLSSAFAPASTNGSTDASSAFFRQQRSSAETSPSSSPALRQAQNAPSSTSAPSDALNLDSNANSDTAATTTATTTTNNNNNNNNCGHDHNAFSATDEASEYAELSLRGVLAHLGPAFLVSIGYLDPGNWATDIEAGSRFGYALIWVLLLANAMALVLQHLASTLGIGSEKHLAQVCREMYPVRAANALWALAELAIIATDLTEVVGVAIGLQLLLRVPLWVGVLLTTADTLLLLAAQHNGMRRLEQLMFVFLALISLCFFAELLLAKPSVSAVLIGAVVPRIPRGALTAATALVGATIMPHNLYLHSALVLNKLPLSRDARTLRLYSRYQLIDAVVALNAAVVINAAILVMAAAAFWASHEVVLTLEKAYELLSNTAPRVFGVDLAPFLFGIALVTAGQGSTLACTMAGQHVMEGFAGWTVPALTRRLATRVLALAPALAVVLAMGNEGTYSLLIWTQVVLSLQLPFAVIPMLRAVSREAYVGEALRVSRPVLTAAWIAAVFIVGLNIALVVSVVMDGWHLVWVRIVLAPLSAAGVAFLLFVLLAPDVRARHRIALQLSDADFDAELSSRASSRASSVDDFSLETDPK